MQVVPSILDEAFGIVAAEGAAAGALPLVARHSGLAEVAAALEEAVDRPGLFSFEPGPGAVERLAQGIERLLGLPGDERTELRAEVSGFVRTHWTWERTATRLLEVGQDSFAEGFRHHEETRVAPNGAGADNPPMDGSGSGGITAPRPGPS